LQAQLLEAMKTILSKLLGLAADLVDVQPVLALFLGGALLAVFLTAILSARSTAEPEGRSSLLWTLYRQFMRLAWSLTLVTFLVATLSLVRTYLHKTVAGFQRTHGRVTEANFKAIQTIWGTPQEQGELRFNLYWEEEVTERIESEDITKPTVTRKKTVRHDITDNPFIASLHEVLLRQNARKKGSALYGGYETACQFTWKLKNPADQDLKSLLKFPLPSATAVYDNLTATLNGEDILPQMQIKDGALLLAREVKAHEALDLAVSFRSRGMSSWYFQVQEPREVRDFTFTLTLPDLTQAHLNFPEGCMTPTAIRPTPDNAGTILVFRLDHAISSKGMGIALPTVAQPGELTTAVLGEVERGWLLIFAMLILGLSLGGVSHAVLLSVLFGTTAACAYGLLGDCSDFLSGFWGTAGLVLVPAFVLLAWLLRRVEPRPAANALSLQFLLFGLVYPLAAGLDSDRQSLYFNISALVFLALAAWQLLRKLRGHQRDGSPTPTAVLEAAT
jgi:hypothetical protein